MALLMQQAASSGDTEAGDRVHRGYRPRSGKEQCPIFPKTSQFLHWSFSDPARTEGTLDERLRCFREVRAQIEEKVTWFLSAEQG